MGGMTKGAFYHHFKSKEEAFNEWIRVSKGAVQYAGSSLGQHLSTPESL